MAKRKKPKPDVPVVVKVDPKLKARWAAVRKRLESAKSQGSSAFDALYSTLGEILNSAPPLYLAGGFATARDFLKAELPGQDEHAVRRNIRIQHFASPSDDTRYGTSKLDAALTYLEARNGGKPFSRLPIAFDHLHIPVADGSTKSLDAVTVEELRTATRDLVHAVHSPSSPIAAAVVAALKSPGLKGVRVHMVGENVTLSGVTPDSLNELGRALAKLRVPHVAAPKKAKSGK